VAPRGPRDTEQADREEDADDRRQHPVVVEKAKSNGREQSGIGRDAERTLGRRQQSQEAAGKQRERAHPWAMWGHGWRPLRPFSSSASRIGHSRIEPALVHELTRTPSARFIARRLRIFLSMSAIFAWAVARTSEQLAF